MLGSEFRTRLELNVLSVEEENHIKLTLTRITEMADSENADSETDRCRGTLPSALLWSSQSTWWELSCFMNEATNEEGWRHVLQQKLYSWSITLWSTTGAYFVPRPLSRRLPTIFSSRTLIVSSLIFRSLIPFELIFAYNAQLLYFASDCQDFPIYWRDCLFSIVYSWLFCP